MIGTISQVFKSHPFLPLFLTISLGYLLGKFRIKRFVLGGIAGSLLVGVLIGQFGFEVPEGVGNIFFALFIYSVGYQGGPQFFRSLNRNTLLQMLSAFITCLLGLFCVLLCAWWFHLDKGTAAGLAAGGLTQSSIIGTAGDTINSLDILGTMKQTLQTNVAVGYAVCYVFGSLGPILMLTAVFPLLMGWDIRKEAVLLAETKESSSINLEPGQFLAIKPVATRIFKLEASSMAVGKTVDELFNQKLKMAVGALIRDKKNLALDANTILKSGDIIAVTAHFSDSPSLEKWLGCETIKPDNLHLIEEKRYVLLTNPKYYGLTIEQWYLQTKSQDHYGVFITSIERLGERIAPSLGVKLKKGDLIEIQGTPENTTLAEKSLGHKKLSGDITDFVFFGLGTSLGMLLGMISFKVFGVEILLGSGVGSLFSGLTFGWLSQKHPKYAQIPSGASNFLRDFGLAMFVSCVGIKAGPDAIKTIQSHGLQLFFLGIFVTIIPQVLSFYFSYYVLRIRNPVVLLATIAGGRSANPGFAALLDKAGNSTPVVAFTATYALANILLSFWGPLIIGLVSYNG